MSLNIIPSQQLMLISAEQTKQHLLFDPKTTSVLAKFQDDHTMGTQAIYYSKTRQFLMGNHNRSFITLWEIGSQTPQMKISLSQVIVFLLEENGFLYGGSQTGTIYIWQLPSGLLLRKIAAFNSQVLSIVPLSNGKIISLSKAELKLWTLYTLLVELQDTPKQSTHLPSQCITGQYQGNLFFTLHSTTICVYCVDSLMLKNVVELSGGSSLCMTMSRTGVYVATNKYLINSYQISELKNKVQSRQIDYVDGNLNINVNGKNENIKVKNVISCLCFARTLGLLISGSITGEITVWQNGLEKKSIQLFKTPIRFISLFPRPQQGTKIHQTHKIKPLHKYQNSKQQQLLTVNPVTTQPPQLQSQKHQEISNQLLLEAMMHELSQPNHILKSQIQLITAQRNKLLEANLKYAQILLNQTDN